MESGSIEITEVDLVAELKRRWKTLMAIGCISLFAGVVSILVPAVTSWAIGVFIGWILVFFGVLQFVDAFSVRETGRVVFRVLGALVTLGIGIWILNSDYKGTFTLTVILGIWFFVSGAVRFISGLRHRGTPGAGVVVLNGVLSLVLGGLILADLPSSATWAIGLLVGIDLIFAGIALITTATAAKNA